MATAAGQALSPGLRDGATHPGALYGGRGNRGGAPVLDAIDPVIREMIGGGR